MAVPDSLQKLLEDGVIDDIKTRLMSGKEATVYVVERQGELIAAKIYKSREQRTFKATASYTEGRNQTRNSRDKRAMGKRTAYGKELVEKSWRDMEFQALSDAWNAGVRVPEPILLYDDVLLMQLLVDEQGNPAPRLADFELPADVAELLHREIYGQIRLLLASGKVHGDLSAFNILIAEGGPTIIDMPQVVDASGNQSAAEILRRDLANVTEHLAKFDARLLRFRDCGLPLWRHYERGTLDSALDPEEGIIRGDAHRSRRVRDAERGRMGRDPGRPGIKVPVVDEPRRGSPQQQHQQQAQQQATQAQADQRSDQRPARPPAEQRFDDRPRPAPHGRRAVNDDQRRGQQPQAQQERRPFSDEQRRGPPQPQERRPFNDDHRRGPPPQQAQQERRPFNDDQRRGPPQQQAQQDRRPHNDDQRRGPPPQQQQQQQQQDRRPYHDDQRRGPPPDRAPQQQQQQQQRRHTGGDDQRWDPPTPQDRRPFSDDHRRPPPDRRPFNGAPSSTNGAGNGANGTGHRDRAPPPDRRPDDDRWGNGPRSQQPFTDEPRRGPPPSSDRNGPPDRRPFGDQRRAPPQIERRPSRTDPGDQGS